MPDFKKIDRRFDVLPEVYRHYHGFYKNVTVTISGREGYNAATTSLWVRAFSQDGHQINHITRPYRSMRAARKAAREFCDCMMKSARTGREQGWPEHSEYDAHMVVYRNYHADRDLPYYDFRRAVPLQNDRHVSMEERRYHAAGFDKHDHSRYMFA
jgi:hypothetical protein